MLKRKLGDIVPSLCIIFYLPRLYENRSVDIYTHIYGNSKATLDIIFIFLDLKFVSSRKICIKIYKYLYLHIMFPKC